MKQDIAMEISSLRWSINLLQRDHSRNNKVEKSSEHGSRQSQITFQVPDSDESPIDFSAITPRDLRALALENYQAGKIDQDTYITLSEELPTHAVDAQGQLMDLSQVTDETGFNFHDYYRNQLEIAMSLGDTSRANVLRAVMAFIEV
jgi:hypothetical protein